MFLFNKKYTFRVGSFLLQILVLKFLNCFIYIKNCFICSITNNLYIIFVAVRNAMVGRGKKMRYGALFRVDEGGPKR